ncbi:MAG: chaperone NapD [Helicobacteraceae bacterium]|nr:chaperone NapD [Helicobacteraceae bacterium]
MNISSIIIKTLAKDLESCAKNLSKINGVEIALKEDSTIIAVIEAENVNEEVKLLKEIESTNGVISASMHYSYFEDELKDEISNMSKDLPKVLNDENIPLKNIRYTGSVDYMMKNK